MTGFWTTCRSERQHILQFYTGLKSVPPMGLKGSDHNQVHTPFPMEEACFCITTVHNDKATFFQT